MKKKVLFLVMSMCILMLAGGCAKKGVTEDLGTTDTTTTEDTSGTTDTTDTTATVTPAAEELPKVEDYVASEYITLGQYKGVEVSVTQLEVSDADIEAKVQSDLAAAATQEDVTGRAVQDGDIVNIDYEGLKDGVAFDGGTATGTDLEIGSNSFIDGFETGLIGANIGDKVALNLTFPESYGNADLAGQAVVFNVTINSIKQNVVPELTEEYVTANTDYDTIDAYKEGVRSDLETSNQSTMDNEKAANVLQAILDSSTIKEIPQTLTDYYTAQIQSSFEQEAAYYGMDLESYVSANNMTMDNYNEYVASMVTMYSQRDLIVNAVAEAEGLTATEDEVAAAVTDYMSYYGVDTEDALYAIITKDEIQDGVVMQKAYDFIIDNAVVTSAAAE
jgi:trigger factor